MTVVNWMPKQFTQVMQQSVRYNISRPTQHTDRIGFSCTIPQKYSS
jgi:hypothetical protein